jgi:hypothetical protein
MNPDPYGFGPPGSGYFRQRFGSGSFYHQTVIVRKALNLLFSDFFMTFIFEKGQCRKQPDPNPLVRGTDLRMRIRTNGSATLLYLIRELCVCLPHLRSVWR